MNKEKILVYFKKKWQSKDETKGIQITNVTSAELTYAKQEMQKTCEHPKNIKSKFLRRLRTKLAVCKGFWYCFSN